MKKPDCVLGDETDVLAIIGKVRKALLDGGQPSQMVEFMDRAFASSDYAVVKALCQEYVEVK